MLGHMDLGRPKKPLLLTNDERLKLQQWARRPKTAQRLALRSRIVLRCAEGLSNQAVARQLGITGATVCKWRERFRTARLEGLADEPRPGAPRAISDAQVEDLITRTLESIPTPSHPLEYPLDGPRHPIVARYGVPHLASLWPATASQRDL